MNSDAEKRPVTITDEERGGLNILPGMLLPNHVTRHPIGLSDDPEENVKNSGEMEDILRTVWEKLGLDKYALGLAAPQIALPSRAFLLKVNDKDISDRLRREGARINENGVLFVANPEMKILSEKPFHYHDEGCLSVQGVLLITSRYKKVHLDWTNGHGKEKFSVDAEGILAVAIQHEMDHLNGKTILDSKVDNHILNTKKHTVGRNELCPCNSGKKYKKCCEKNQDGRLTLEAVQ